MVNNRKCQIIVSLKCGNSPRMKFLKEFNSALVQGDLEFIKKSIMENITWELVGNKTIKGKDEFIREVEEIKKALPYEFHISNIITNGKYASLNGKVIEKSNSIYSFCDIYEFKNTKAKDIQSITSYLIDI